MIKNKAKSEAKKTPKGKPGRKSSGLKALTPEQARYAVNKAMVSVVRAAAGLQDAAARLPGAVDGAPSLARILQGDLTVASMLVADPDSGEVALRPVLRSSDHEKRLRSAGVPPELLFVAAAFVRDVDGATVGKLTSSYGEGLGGGTAGEPERVFAAMQRLTRAQSGLNRGERFTVWAALVFGLTLNDIGWALYGGRFGSHPGRLIDAAALVLEGALERMQPWYLAHA